MEAKAKIIRAPSHLIHRPACKLRNLARISAVAGASFLLCALCGLGGCKRASRQSVTVTVLDPEWSQPDELPAAERESQEFTRETGILVNHLSVPETSLTQLGLWRKLLGERGPIPDVLAIDVIWPGILDEYLMDLKPYAAAELTVESGGFALPRPDWRLSLSDGPSARVRLRPSSQNMG